MTGFYPSSISFRRVNADYVYFNVSGTQSTRSGGYTNERNTTKEVMMSRENAEELLADLQNALE